VKKTKCLADEEFRDLKSQMNEELRTRREIDLKVCVVIVVRTHTSLIC